MAKKVEKKEEIIKEEKCNCECNCECNCGCNNKELTEYVKYTFYTLVCILVCALVSTIFIIILAVDNDKENGNKNTSTYSSTSNSGSNNGNGSQTVTQTSSDYDVSMFKEIDINGFMSLYNGPEKSVIYIGRPTCGYCVKFLPSLQRAQSEFGYQTYYYDTDKLTADDYYAIIALNSFLEENFGSTPMVLVVQNGQILSANNDGQGWVGYAEYDQFAQYLKNLGF